MSEKANEVKAGISPCVYCGRRSVALTPKGRPVCEEHRSPDKRASVDKVADDYLEDLTNQHEPRS